jgi:hypothetical protein
MIHHWHTLVENRQSDKITELLADNVVLHSPVVHTEVKGKQLVSLYLHAAFHTFLNDSFQYVREFNNGNQYVLEFSTEINGITVNGVDMIVFDDNEKIVDFKVMVRPLKAINLIHQAMGQMLEKLQTN